MLLLLLLPLGLGLLLLLELVPLVLLLLLWMLSAIDETALWLMELDDPCIRSLASSSPVLSGPLLQWAKIWLSGSRFESGMMSLWWTWLGSKIVSG